MGSIQDGDLFLMQQIVLGIAIGGLVGWLGGSLVSSFSNRDWMNNTFQRLVSGSLAILCFSLAEMFHGNGFIAAFAGGLLLGTSTKSDQIRESTSTSRRWSATAMSRWVGSKRPAGGRAMSTCLQTKALTYFLSNTPGSPIYCCRCSSRSSDRSEGEQAL